MSNARKLQSKYAEFGARSMRNGWDVVVVVEGEEGALKIEN